MNLKYKVTVVKKVKVVIPVLANDGDQARELVNKLLEKRDYDFMFGCLSDHDYDYSISSIWRVSDQEFSILAENIEFVLPDGSHDWT